jgi:hypothetical protein
VSLSALGAECCPIGEASVTSNTSVLPWALSAAQVVERRLELSAVCVAERPESLSAASSLWVACVAVGCSCC